MKKERVAEPPPLVARGRGAPPPAGGGTLVDLTGVRIARSLGRRSRYRYVQPRVEREGQGFRIVSPNCSRTIDPTGGDIPIAWLVPAGADRWLLYRRDHARQDWTLHAEAQPLAAALRRLCDDPLHEFWP